MQPGALRFAISAMRPISSTVSDGRRLYPRERWIYTMRCAGVIAFSMPA